MAEDSTYVSQRDEFEIEALALEYLKLARLHNSEPVDVLLAINRLAVFTDRPTADLEIIRMPLSDLNKYEAYATSKPARIFVNDNFFDASRFDSAELRETMAHELGHVVMHPGLAKARSLNPRSLPNFLKTRPNHDSELHAVFFSACFLMPRVLVDRYDNAEDLAAGANVPMQLATLRFDWVKSVRAKVIPFPLRREIETLRGQVVGVSKSDVLRKDLWDACDRFPGESPEVWRAVRGWGIRWDKFDAACNGGWRIVNKRIVSWEEESSR